MVVFCDESEVRQPLEVAPVVSDRVQDVSVGLGKAAAGAAA